MSIRLSAVAACTALALLPGCETRPPLPCEAPASYNAQAANEAAPVPPGPQPLGAVGRRGVRMTDGLTNLVYVEEVRAGRRPNGAAEASVRLLNCSATPVQLEGATQFFDAGGAQAEPPSVWKRVFLTPRTSRDYTELSTGRAAGSFFVDIRGGQ